MKTFTEFKKEINEAWAENYKSDFKRKELEFELRYDNQRFAKLDEPYHIYIDGKVWKKDGKPVEFDNARAASMVAASIQKKNPAKSIETHHYSIFDKTGGILKGK
jgi:hypothetical protein